MKSGEIGTVFEFSLRIKITILVCACLLAGGFSTAYWQFHETHGAQIEFTAIAISTGLALYAAYFAAFNAKAAADSEKRKEAYRFLDRLNEIDSVTVRMEVDAAITPGSPEASEQFKAINEDECKKRCVMVLLGTFEDIAIAISCGHADEEVLKRSLKGMVPFYFDGLIGYISQLRINEGNEEYYSEMEELKKRWATK